MGAVKSKSIDIDKIHLSQFGYFGSAEGTTGFAIEQAVLCSYPKLDPVFIKENHKDVLQKLKESREFIEHRSHMEKKAVGSCERHSAILHKIAVDVYQRLKPNEIIPIFINTLFPEVNFCGVSLCDAGTGFIVNKATDAEIAAASALETQFPMLNKLYNDILNNPSSFILHKRRLTDIESQMATHLQKLPNISTVIKSPPRKTAFFVHCMIKSFFSDLYKMIELESNVTYLKSNNNNDNISSKDNLKTDSNVPKASSLNKSEDTKNSSNVNVNTIIIPPTHTHKVVNSSQEDAVVHSSNSKSLKAPPTSMSLIAHATSSQLSNSSLVVSNTPIPANQSSRAALHGSSSGLSVNDIPKSALSSTSINPVSNHSGLNVQHAEGRADANVIYDISPSYDGKVGGSKYVYVVKPPINGFKNETEKGKDFEDEEISGLKATDAVDKHITDNNQLLADSKGTNVGDEIDLKGTSAPCCFC